MDSDNADTHDYNEGARQGAAERPDEQPSERQIVGKRLRTAREKLGLTQDDVAGALGIPRTSIIAMEAGRRNVTALELRRLGRLYRRSVQWLLGEEDDAAVESALYRATNALSDDDKEQVIRFAQFLASAGPPRTSHGRRAAPPAFGSPPQRNPEPTEQ